MLRIIAIGAALAASIAFSPPASAAKGPPGPHDAPPVVHRVTHLGSHSSYAFVEAPTTARAQPSQRAKALARLGLSTYWGTSTLVLVLAQTEGPKGQGWTEVRLPVPPHDRTAWVPTEDLSALQTVNTWLRIDRERFRATLIRDRRPIFRARIGVGLPQWPTPTGQFVVEQRITPTETDSIYGALAFGTSAHSNVLTDWPNQGQVGIHGTNEPWLIPGRISHGCIRLRNRDILRLDRLMPVGTPITIR